MILPADLLRLPSTPGAHEGEVPPTSTRYVLLQQRQEAARNAAEEVGTEASLPVAPAPIAVEPGMLLAGRYRLIARLGEGGMGVVWRARSLALDIDVAIKLIHPSARVPNGRERLLREARAAARVVHPAAARVLDFGVAEREIPFLVMELLRGRSLAARLRDEGPLAPTAAARLLLPVLGALEAAHQQGIVHRDVKPANILLAEEGARIAPKLLDFGIAAIQPCAWSSKLASYQPLYGTPRYLAPEQMRGAPAADPRADIWSACLVLYEAVCFRPGFSVRRDPAGRLCHPPALAVEPELAAILARGLELDPRARWQTARALGATLARWALARGVSADSAGSALAETWLDG